MEENTTYNLVERLLKRAEIRRQITTRKSVQEGKPDRIADLLEEAAFRIQTLESYLNDC
jgi:Trm5-related predicted tRNA methylase